MNNQEKFVGYLKRHYILYVNFMQPQMTMIK